MFNIVSLFAVTALTLVQCRSGHIIANPKLDMDNTLTSHDTSRRRVIRNYVKIESPPPATTRYSPGGTIVECVIASNPAPSAVWMKNGVPVSDFEEESNEIMSMDPKSYVSFTTRLVVTDGVNGDVITCVGVAGLKQDSASTTLYVEDGETDISLTSAPIISAFYISVLQSIGTSLTLPCRAFSPTEYEVTWMDNHDRRVYSNSRIRVLPSGDLHFSSLVWEDMGVYTCMVKNKHGKVAESTFLYPCLPS